MNRDEMYLSLGVSDKVLQFGEAVLDELKPRFAGIEEIAELNQAKVIGAMQKNRVNATHFAASTGYGYDDEGRDNLERVYASAFHTEAALVRPQITCGTHALAVALSANLLPGDELLSPVGKPYDTLEEVIGISGTPGNGSLMDYGVEYGEVPLTGGGLPDLDAIAQAVPGAKVAYIQRSRGYSLRPAYTVEQIQEIVQTVRRVSPDTIVMVDNCYGEFVQRREPTSVGADLIIGSLIKNAGGSIAQTGGYIAGRKDLVELCSYRLTCVGMGKEVGCTLHQNKEMFLGLFFAPDVVANALKTAAFAAELFRLMGFDSYPALSETRGDIITAIRFGTPELLTAFCQGVQKGAPVDAFVTPEPWDMPGYTSQVIMAAGAFTMGASIELSADAPMREPYAVWMQGGITYASGRIGILLAAQEMLDRGLILK